MKKHRQAEPVQDIAQIDIDRHAVIEASAGTGKTYCIENLVVRLIREKGVPLEQILLVTFTEKATGDLHERIRQNILRELDRGTGDDAGLREALENFDTASIFTIHGFCQRVLQQYAFENGGRFAMELVDDEPLYESELRWQQRRDWPEKYGDQLFQLIALAGYPRANRDQSEWDRDVLELARRFCPDGGDRLLPEHVDDIDLDKWNAQLAVECDALLELLGKPKHPVRRSKIYWWYKQREMADRPRWDRLNQVIVPLLEFLQAHGRKPQSLINFVRLTGHCQACPGFPKYGFSLLLRDLKLQGEETLDPYYDALKTAMEGLDALAGKFQVNMLATRLAAETVRGLKRDVRRHKEEHGLISFDDMLLLVAQALDPNHNERADQLLAQLRRRFKYALVDEFQDTDPVQWQVFRRIFLGTDEQRLFLIGDPKQAIYSFRGADLRTYLDAKEQMLNRFDATYYSLPVNWRSMPGLIQSLNRVCSSRDWFHPDGQVPFTPAQAPPDADRRARIYADDTRRAAVTVVDLNKEKRTLTLARRWMAAFIADEIERLLTSNPLTIERHGRPDRLRASDICVLIRKTSEAEYVEEFLTRNNIAYSFYKKSGLYQSEEARQLYYLFAAIAAPGEPKAVRKALLTHFFGVDLKDLEKYEELPEDHPVRCRLRHWNGLARGRNWARLFQSIQTDTGVLFRENQAAGGDRRLTNYAHILEDLVCIAQAENLDFTGVLERLRNYRQQQVELSDADNLHRIESEAAKVQIMTIHTAKGLEFPVVFLAGGFTTNKEGSFWRYHDPQGRVVYDLTRTPEAEPVFQCEQEEEDRRLYYVALTRAVYKLYLPKFRPKRNSGWSGPVATFLFESLNSCLEDQEERVDIRVVDEKGKDHGGAPPWLPCLDPMDLDLSQNAAAGCLSLANATLLPAPLPKRVNARLVGSFSMFAHGRHLIPEPTILQRMEHFGEDGSVFDDEVATTWDQMPLDESTAVPELPKGIATGLLLHDVLEHVDYDQVAIAESPADLLVSGSLASEWIEGLLEQYPLSRPDGSAAAFSWAPQVAAMVFNTLRVGLPLGFRMVDVPAVDRRNEVEFTFPATNGAQIPEAAYRKGFLTGYIDMVFRYGGKYYILDWKSNYLDRYRPEDLAASMTEAGYHLQYKVYTIAVLRWLQKLQPDFNYDQQFGGILYLYLRGLSETGDGVFFHRPEGLDEIACYTRELGELFKMEPEAVL